MPTISTSDAEFYYEFAGPADARVIVFVNALGATLEMWREQVAAFAARYRCLTYDANGHGHTPPIPMAPAIDDLADDLEQLLTALSIERASVVGASIGGMTALSFAARYPVRLDRLVLISTTPKMSHPQPWSERAALVRRDGLDEMASAAMKRWFTQDFAAAQPDRIEETRRHFVETDPESYALCCEAIAAMDMTEVIKDITAPTLVVRAAGDVSTPPETSELLRRNIDGADSVTVPDAAHLAMIERADEVSALISAFLDLRRAVGASNPASI